VAGRLEGKVALITAAGQGIGHATALAMAREGATVYATDVNAKALERYAGTAGITARTLDVLDDAAVAKTIAQLPPLSILFNCAGYVHNGTVLDCTPKDWEFSFNLNVRAMYMTIKCALPAMLANGGGSIINMASVAGSIKGIPNRFVYGASKAAVIGLTKDQRPGRSGRGAQGVHRPSADGAPRQSRGDRTYRRVSRLGRVGVRDRKRLFRRRWNDHLT